MIKNILTAAALAIALPFAANAATISGEIAIGGVVDFGNSDFDFSDNVGNVDFDGDGQVAIFDVTTTGDFDGLEGDVVTLFDINFAAPGAVWSVGGFTFTANSYSNISEYYFDAAGVLSYTDATFDPTPGVMSFSSQGHDGADLEFFSSSTLAVPVPAAGLLLLTALGGLGVASRRRKAA